MKKIISDLYNFLSALSIVDIIFFVAVMILLILLVTMYYIIKINTNGEEEIKNDNLKNLNKEIKKENVIAQEEDLTTDILNAFDLPKAEDEPDELIDLATITKAIEYGQNQSIDMSVYEEEQEQKAIISYDELIKKHNAVKLNYKNGIEDNEITVKEIDLNNLTGTIANGEEDVTIAHATVINYDKEEEFLNALKELQNKLI